MAGFERGATSQMMAPMAEEVAAAMAGLLEAAADAADSKGGGEGASSATDTPAAMVARWVQRRINHVYRRALKVVVKST
jgi:hypothetical protein